MSDQEDHRPRSIRLEEHELRAVVKTAVHETLVTLGVDASNPTEMQKDFHHLREWREATGKMKMKILLTFAAVITAGLAGIVWVAVGGSKLP